MSHGEIRCSRIAGRTARVVQFVDDGERKGEQMKLEFQSSGLKNT